LLDHGFTVLAAVRSEQKADILRNLFKGHEELLDFTIVEDFTTPGAFDHAVGDTSGIIHCGSPMPTVDTQKDPTSYIKPAIGGTLEILKSASQSPEVKRVVYTSSVVAVMEPGGAPFSYDENMWSQGFIKASMEQGAQAPSLWKYSASKTLAEQVGNTSRP
jgi:nucleoside-diphosphate-sugar epimerase